MKRANNGLPIISPDAVRGARDALKLTQGEFAAYLGIDQTTVSRWEAGELPKRGLAQALLTRVLQDIERMRPIATKR